MSIHILFAAAKLYVKLSFGAERLIYKIGRHLVKS